MTARVAFAVSLLLYVGAVLWGWATLPDRVPVHWGGWGDDRVLARGRAVAELAAIGAVMSVLLGGGALLVHRRFSTGLWVVGTATHVLLTVVVVQVALVADDPAPRLGPLFWVAFAAYLVVVVGSAATSALRRHGPEHREGAA